MFVTSLAASLYTPNSYNKVAWCVLLTSFLSIFGIHLYLIPVEGSLEVKQVVVSKPDVASKPRQPKELAEKDPCKQLDTQYELQGVVFDHETTVALVKEIESGVIRLISNIEADGMKLKTAELSRVKVQRNGCSFTLYLNQPSDKDGHEISTHHTTAI